MKDDGHKIKALALRKLNKNAFIDFFPSVAADTETEQIAFQVVKDSKTKELSNGDTRAAWKKLNSKYESTRAPNQL